MFILICKHSCYMSCLLHSRVQFSIKSIYIIAITNSTANSSLAVLESILPFSSYFAYICFDKLSSAFLVYLSKAMSFPFF